MQTEDDEEAQETGPLCDVAEEEMLLGMPVTFSPINRGASQKTHEFTTSTLAPECPVRAIALFRIFTAAFTSRSRTRLQ